MCVATGPTYARTVLYCTYVRTCELKLPLIFFLKKKKAPYETVSREWSWLPHASTNDVWLHSSLSSCCAGNPPPPPPPTSGQHMLPRSCSHPARLHRYSKISINLPNQTVPGPTFSPKNNDTSHSLHQCMLNVGPNPGGEGVPSLGPGRV